MFPIIPALLETNVKHIFVTVIAHNRKLFSELLSEGPSVS